MADPVEENPTEAVKDKPHSPLARVSSAFGNYELLDEIARGGMGVVYRARQRGLNRIVALKMILAGPFASKQTILRFRAEAEAAANLRHANIVAIHETGEVDGQHYFSMDYVEGRNLADLVREQPLTSKKAAEYVLKVAGAVHYAHERKVLHRDLKPSNVLIDENDEPRITDFGLAKKLSGTSAITATGQLLGSPGYMPPEQASSRRGSFGPHSDVYSLGAVLFHLLTGRPPFQAENLTDTLDQLLNRDPVPPRQLNPSVPQDLETICLKCLEKEPAKRYPTADAVAEELGRFLGDEPILARPVSRAERLLRWCRRNPLLSGLGATVVLLLLTVSLGSPIAAFQINQSRARARSEAIAARQSLYAADMLLAQESYDQGNVMRAIDLLLRHRPKSGEDDLRGFAWRYLWRLCRQGDALSTAVSHKSPLNQIAWSSHGLLATAGSDGVIQIYDSVREKIVATLNPGDSIRAVAFSPDGTLLATGDDRGRVLLWTVNPFERARALEFGGAIEALAFSPDRSWLVMSVLGMGLKVWSLHRDELLSQTLGGGRHAIHLTFSKDGRHLASGGSAMPVRLWTVPGFEEIAPIEEPHSGFSTGVAFSPDGRILATGSWDTTIKLWEFPSRKLLSTLKGHLSHVWDLDIAPDGRTLASASGDGTIKLWPLDGELRPETAPSRTLLGHTGSVASVRFNARGDLLASGSADQTARLWNVHQTQPPNRLIGHADWVYSVAVSSDRRRLATGSFDGTIRLWNAETLDSRVIENAHRNNVFTVIFSPTDPWLVSCDAVWRVNAHRDFTTPGEVKIWDVESGSPIASLPGFATGVRAIAMSPRVELLATGDHDGIVRFWNLENLPPSDLGYVGANNLAPGNNEAVMRVANLQFSADGTRLAILRQFHSAEVWNVNPLKRVSVLGNSGDWSYALALSPDGRWLVGGHQLVNIWDLESGQLHTSFPGHGATIMCAAFSPDGRTLATGSVDHSIKLWNLAIRKEVATLRGHEGPVSAVVFSNDGNLLLSGSEDKTAYLWRATPVTELP